MITFIDAINSLRPGATWSIIGDEVYENLDWQDKNQTKPTEKEINDEIARLSEQDAVVACKETAKQMLLDSDWSQTNDVVQILVNYQEFQTYRAAVRAIYFNPVAKPVWPNEPSPQWSSQ